MYRCPRCGNWMTWRWGYGDAYWICNCCGYSPTTTKAKVDKWTTSIWLWL